MNDYIYGVWRGKPARQVRATGVRQQWVAEHGFWSGLGLGYADEFRAFPDQLTADDNSPHNGIKTVGQP